MTSSQLSSFLGRRSQKKVTLSCFVAVMLFFGCWFPDQFFFSLFTLSIPSLDLRLDSLLYHVFVNLGYFNSALNPILFGLLNPNYRKAFKQMFGSGENAQNTHNTSEIQK